VKGGRSRTWLGVGRAAGRRDAARLALAGGAAWLSSWTDSGCRLALRAFGSFQSFTALAHGGSRARPVALLGWCGDALVWLLAANGIWLGMLAVDALRTPDREALIVLREAPPAFSVGRALTRRLHWINRSDIRSPSWCARSSWTAGRRGRADPAPGNTGRRRTGKHSSDAGHRGKGRGGAIEARILGPLPS
jgi:hypothetical protein